MPELSADITVHRVPIKEECKPVQQKLRRMRPDVAIKIREDVKKQFDAGFLQVVNYSEWVANVVPVPKKYGKVQMCVDYRDLNKASPKDNFPLPHIDTLADNTASYSLFSFINGFFGYTQIKMHPEDMEKTAFITLWGTFCYKKAVKGSTIVNFLASRALEDYEPLKFDFPNEDLTYMATTEEDTPEDHPCKLNFDRASNVVGNRIGVVLISPNGDHYPLCKLDFDCTKNMTEYEACIIRICAAIERKIKLKGEWETRDPKLINYRKLVLELIEVFDDITFCYLPRDENQMADALATLASMIRVNKREDMKPIQMSIYEAPTHCCNIDEEEERDVYPWYHDILRYVKNSGYLDQITKNGKRMLRRLASDYVLNKEILYKKRKDEVLLRCVDVVEAKKILEEVHEGVCGTHANGFIMAKQIMRLGYYWSTMEGDCISYAKKYHKCQIYGDKILVPPSPLHVMTSPWPFFMWGMDVIGLISPKSSNGHQFTFMVIDYFTKWVETATYANVTKSIVSKFLKKEIICRYGMPDRIISDNTLNLNNSVIVEVCS
ncbi:uncharacterized protein LOC108471417 [Gossypium arboreum]|uniref:uncharacterized protein LOC108471417 n=1 Tax=Gossypium arboreum TaxID=29729 RepID=UPI0008194DD3|nr:uncharacterized protein LOC108471417 [Gossypium arboreum]